MRELLGHGSLFDHLQVPAWMVAPRPIARSPFNLAHQGRARLVDYEGLDGLFERLGEIIAAPTGRCYISAYWPELDAMAHEYGVESGQAVALFRRLDAALAKFCGGLAGTATTLLVTADHGLVDTRPEWTVALADHPELAETLVLPLCGEPRAAYCYLHPGQERAFEAYVSKHLHRCALAYPSGQLLDEGLFGLGTPHPRLSERIGHYTLVMRDRYVIRDQLLGETPHPLVGVHGGVSAEEMHVPLSVFRSDP